MAKMPWLTTSDLLDELKKSKKNELSSKCSDVIIDGFNVYLQSASYFFTYSVSKQQNFTDTMRLFDNQMIDKIGWNAYVGEEKKRIQLNKEEFTRVYLAGVKHKTNCLTRLNDVLYPLVDAAENKETIVRIYWDEELPAESLSLKEDKTVEKQLSNLVKKDGSLEQADMMTMMALVQISSKIS